MEKNIWLPYGKKLWQSIGFTISVEEIIGMGIDFAKYQNLSGVIRHRFGFKLLQKLSRLDKSEYISKLNKIKQVYDKFTYTGVLDEILQFIKDRSKSSLQELPFRYSIGGSLDYQGLHPRPP